MLNLPTMETQKQKPQVPPQVVSDEMFNEIKLWVAQQAAKGLSARGIRRAVKQKWNIDYKM
jgi:hypothetical protein